MDLKLKGKVALVSGSSSGIGFAIASELAKEGCSVILNGRTGIKLQHAKSALQDAVSIVADVTDEQECERLAREAASIYGKIDILVTNVGSGASVPVGLENKDEWERMLSINLFSSTQLVSASYGHLKKTKGSILCISSICGGESIGCPIAYAGAKAALNNYVSNFARYCGKDGVRINALSPGNILFPGSVWDRKLRENPDIVNQMLESQVPLRRLGSTEDVSKMAAFLVSPVSAFTTGSLVVVDGGQTRAFA